MTRLLFLSLLLAATSHAFHTAPTSVRRSFVGRAGTNQSTRTYSPFAVIDTNSFHGKKAPLVIVNLAATASEDDSDAENSGDEVEVTDDKDSNFKKDAKAKMAKKVSGRKKRVLGGYKIVSALYGVSGLASLFLIDAPRLLLIQAASGPLLAAGFAHILSDAASNDRLKSETYKRLNLVLGQYGLIGLIAAFFVKQLRQQPLLWIIPSLIAMVNSIKGYGYGLKGWELEKTSAVDDLVQGTKTSIKCLLSVPKNISSAGYLAATLTMGTLTTLKLLEILQLVVQTGISDSYNSAVIGTRVLRYSKLTLLTAATFTLKDAADRGRLQGTTFVELNYMVALALGSFASTYIGIYIYINYDCRSRLPASCCFCDCLL